MTDLVGSFDWDQLSVPEEDPEQVKIRLDAIHRQVLEQKGISDKPDKNSPGFRPDAAQAREVAVMAALGLEAPDIALVLNIEEKMLKIYYKRELKVTHNLANMMVARQALSMALSGRFPDMTKFWLKTRGKGQWVETQKVDINQNINGSIEVTTAKDRLKQMLVNQSSLSGPVVDVDSST